MSGTVELNCSINRYLDLMMKSEANQLIDTLPYTGRTPTCLNPDWWLSACFLLIFGVPILECGAVLTCAFGLICRQHKQHCQGTIPPIILPLQKRVWQMQDGDAALTVRVAGEGH